MGSESPIKSNLSTFWGIQKIYFEISMSSEKYVPSPKHEKYGWGSIDPIVEKGEGQDLLEKGIKNGKQIYNITSRGELVKYQPDNTPEKGHHAYQIEKSRDIPPSVVKEWYRQGKITYAEYKRIIKGKKGKVKVPSNGKNMLQAY